MRATYVFKVNFNWTLSYRPRLSNGLFLSGFPSKITYAFIVSTVCATRPALPHFFIYLLVSCLVSKMNYRSSKCAVYVFIARAKCSTGVDPVTGGYNLRGDNLLCFGNMCYSFGENHCLHVCGRSYPLVCSEDVGSRYLRNVSICLPDFRA
jgi:hypothetical protein